MRSLKDLYRKNVYGIMGTLIFHISLVTIFLVSEIKMKVKVEKEDSVLLDFATFDEKEKVEKQLSVRKEKQELNIASGKSSGNSQNTESNRAVNDAPNNAVKKDEFFDDNYRNDIEQAKKLVADVNKQLSKKSTITQKYEMPEATTEGQSSDSIKNVVYSGKSNIHYFLKNRFHLRLPIPVYLAKGGGTITVDIQVDRSGRVVKAEVRTAKNISDPMLPVYATQAAERTLFNSDTKAGEIQRGTITYKFVAQ
jgi:hypothetical protein